MRGMIPTYPSFGEFSFSSLSLSLCLSCAWRARLSVCVSCLERSRGCTSVIDICGIAFSFSRLRYPIL